MGFSDIFLVLNLKFIGFMMDYDWEFWGAFIVIVTGILAVGKILKRVK